MLPSVRSIAVIFCLGFFAVFAGLRLSAPWPLGAGGFSVHSAHAASLVIGANGAVDRRGLGAPGPFETRFSAGAFAALAMPSTTLSLAAPALAEIPAEDAAEAPPAPAPAPVALVAAAAPIVEPAPVAFAIAALSPPFEMVLPPILEPAPVVVTALSADRAPAVPEPLPVAIEQPVLPEPVLLAPVVTMAALPTEAPPVEPSPAADDDDGIVTSAVPALVDVPQPVARPDVAAAVRAAAARRNAQVAAQKRASVARAAAQAREKIAATAARAARARTTQARQAANAAAAQRDAAPFGGIFGP